MSKYNGNRKSLKYIRDDTLFYDHQIDGVRWGARRPSFLLADEMGLGKSLTSLTVAAVDFERGIASKILVVCPAFLLWNWAEEIEKQTNFSCKVLVGSPLARHAIIDEFHESGEYDILIVGYETLTNDLDYINRYVWDFVIVDEAHYIKSDKSKRSKAVRSIRRRRGIPLTGSPMLNRPNELWAILNFVDPNRFKNYWQFVHRYCVMGGYKMKQIVGAKNTAELRGILDQYMLRRLKKDCLDLPDKQIINIKVDLHPEQAKIYRRMEDELMVQVPADPDPVKAENILTQMLRLKQIADSPAALLTPDGAPAGLPDDSFKLDRATEMCIEFTRDEDDPTPIVMFTQFRAVLGLMRGRLEREGIPVFALHGDVKKEDRQEVIRQWSATKGTAQPGVMIVMLQMSVGLNLTAANKAIFIDSLYVPKLNEQAEDRIHRIGASTEHPVQIYYLIARGTVEERIQKILASKRKLFNELIETDPTWKAKLMAEMKKVPVALA